MSTVALNKHISIMPSRLHALCKMLQLESEDLWN